MQVNWWEWAWKTLCDPERVWGKWFLSRLLQTECDDLETVEVVPSETSQQKSQGLDRYMDKLLLIQADRKNHKVYIEFQSFYDNTMALRMLERALRIAGTPNTNVHNVEQYTLSDFYIVDTHNIGQSITTVRTLELNINKHLIAIPFPVINACNKIPEIGQMMEAATMEEWMESFKRLGGLCKGYLQDTPGRGIFIAACIILSQCSVFAPTDSGAQQIKKLPGVADFEGITFEEAGYRFGVAEAKVDALKNLQESLRITEQEARKLLGMDESLAVKKAPSKPISNPNL